MHSQDIESDYDRHAKVHFLVFEQQCIFLCSFQPSL